jgi:hypothetical protein
MKNDLIKIRRVKGKNEFDVKKIKSISKSLTNEVSLKKIPKDNEIWMPNTHITENDISSHEDIEVVDRAISPKLNSLIQ